MRPQSLADGIPGLVLLAAERDESPGPWLARMLSEPAIVHPDDASLFEGAPAVALALSVTGESGTLTSLDTHIATLTKRRLEAAAQRQHRGDPPHKSEFDLISGLTGLGVYLLHRGQDRQLLHAVLTYLVDLTRTCSNGRPGWWATEGPTGPDPAWREGHGSLGMAHGIAGPLTLLALAMRRGIVVADHAKAMRRLYAWIDLHRQDDPHPWWPGTVTLREHTLGVSRYRERPRPSWCDGTPGIARALQVAGIALDDDQLQHTAEAALLSCVSDEDQLALLEDTSLCHGWAGVLHTAWRAGQHAPALREMLPRLLARYRTAAPPIEPGFLTGTTGAALAELVATTDLPPATGWDAVLLLND